MVFFRLGKIEKGGAKEAEPLKELAGKKGDTREDKVELAGGGSVASSQPVSSPSDPEPQARESEKREKKKKAKHTDDAEPGPLSGAPASSSTASASAMPSSGMVGGSLGSSSQARSQPGLSVNDFISKTKNQQRQGLKPSGPELIAYARYLGIDPVADHDLLWIAVEALEAPLPSDWTEHFDSNDRVFYYNATMRVSSWTHPLEHIYRETYKTIVNFRNANMSAQERHEKLQQLQMEVKQMEIDVHKEIAQWSDHTDEQGNRFYFNREERQSTWTDPRPAKCQVFYLRMKMMRLLSAGSGSSGIPGFADTKGELGSRFAPLVGGAGEMEDPALKRPKVGAGRQEWGESADAAGEHSEARLGENAPASDSDSDDDGSKKKKKKKKKKDKKHREAEKPQDAMETLGRHSAAPPPRLSQNLRNSQSEPAVGGKPLLGNVEDARGGLGGLQPSASSAATLFDPNAEGLSTVGRQKVKAGIRLEPLGPSSIESHPSSIENHTSGPARDRSPGVLGVRNSASVPSL